MFETNWHLFGQNNIVFTRKSVLLAVYKVGLASVDQRKYMSCSGQGTFTLELPFEIVQLDKGA